MAPSNYGTLRAVPCSGWDGMLAAFNVSPLLLMVVHLPVAEMMPPLGFGRSLRVSTSRHSLIKATRSTH